MNLTALKFGIVHSLIGQNDGVSIVIDQSVQSMVDYLNIPLGNIYFLAGHAPERFNTMQDDIFWHKNFPNKMIVENYSNEESVDELEILIQKHAKIAKDKIEEFVEKYQLDLLIVHNMAHPYNFIAAVGLGMYLEERRVEKLRWPKVLLWWHDSYFERDKFTNPNSIIKKYLKYLPGNHLDGIVFINSEQPVFAKKYYEKGKTKDISHFFDKKTDVIPNTTEINWNWEKCSNKTDSIIYPKQDHYNKSFLKDVGILDILNEFDAKISDMILLLQHTRIVPRKRIDRAIEFAFQLENKIISENQDKVIILLVSGHSGDEDEAFRKSLEELYKSILSKNSNAKVAVIFGEKVIFPSRVIVVDRKYYRFADIPAIVASFGGMGTYFSEIEGYGNNLLEMIAAGLPVAVNRYPIYIQEIEKLELDLVETENCEITNDIIDKSYEMLFDIAKRNKSTIHNLNILNDKLHHKVIAQKLAPILRNLFWYE